MEFEALYWVLRYFSASMSFYLIISYYVLWVGLMYELPLLPLSFNNHFAGICFSFDSAVSKLSNEPVSLSTFPGKALEYSPWLYPDILISLKSAVFSPDYSKFGCHFCPLELQPWRLHYQKNDSSSILSTFLSTTLLLCPISRTKFRISIMDSASPHEAFSLMILKWMLRSPKQPKSIDGLVQLTHRFARSLVKQQRLCSTLHMDPTLLLSFARIFVRWNSVIARFLQFSVMALCLPVWLVS